MHLVLTQRNEASIEPCASITCYESKGMLHTVIFDKEGNAIYENITNR